MTIAKRAWVPALLGAGLVAGLVGLCAAVADEPKPAGDATLVVIDAAGKEQKLKTWKFAAGTRHLSWLEPAKEGEDKPKDGDKPKDPDKPKEVEPKKNAPRGGPRAKPVAAGPEALQFRDENSTDFKEGILTFMPLTALKAIDFDAEQETMTVKAAAGDKADASETLTGTTKYKGINKITIEAEVDKGDLGVGEVKFQGGVPKGIRGVRFPAAKALPAPAGRTATVTVAGSSNNTQKATDLQPLYLFTDGTERVLPTLFFKKTLKINVAKLKKLRGVKVEDLDNPEFGVTLADGEEETYTLMPKVTIDGRDAILEGLVGRVPAGYKLFPMYTIGEVQFEDGK
jgi:hypothetical protein